MNINKISIFVYINIKNFHIKTKKTAKKVKNTRKKKIKKKKKLLLLN